MLLFPKPVRKAKLKRPLRRKSWLKPGSKRIAAKAVCD
jgi:hypothetical protein